MPADPIAIELLVNAIRQASSFYTRPVQCSSYPKAFVMGLVAEEVGFINHTVQIYSGRYLFYRNEKPELAPEFTGGKHASY